MHPKVRRSVEYMWDWGDNIAYLALTGNEDRAVKILERHLADVENSHNPLAQLSFLRSALLLIEILADRKDAALELLKETADPKGGSRRRK